MTVGERTTHTAEDGSVWVLRWAYYTPTLRDIRDIEAAQAEDRAGPLLDFLDRSVATVTRDGEPAELLDMPVTLLEGVVGAHPQFRSASDPA